MVPGKRIGSDLGKLNNKNNSNGYSYNNNNKGCKSICILYMSEQRPNYSNYVYPNSIHLNSIHPNSVHLNSVHLNSVQSNSVHSNIPGCICGTSSVVNLGHGE